MRGDDGFGSELISRIRGITIPVIDAGVTPENHIGAVMKHSPSSILIADAAELGESPGTLMLLERDEILGVGGFSTHNMSPRLFMDHLEELTGAGIRMIAVQPGSTGFGAGLSPEVETQVRRLTDFIRSRVGTPER